MHNTSTIGGVSDAGSAADGPIVICNVMCPALACAGRVLPSPRPVAARRADPW